jgi:hypothetical protein
MALALALSCAAVLAQQPPPATNLGPDANGNPRRLALKTNHTSNYDESRVGSYTLPDPLVLADGTKVRDAKTWQRVRRPEIVRLYESEIFGRVPATAPRVAWKVVGDTKGDALVTVKHVDGVIGGAETPRIRLTLYTPAKITRHVPVILLLNFGGGGTTPAANLPSGEPPVARDIVARGWGYATIFYQDIQPDRADTAKEGVIHLARPAGQTPGDTEWGAIAVWAWAVSRTIDYLATDRAVDARHIALQGHSRLGKTALWASALDPRIAAVYSSCAGEMGSALSRRDWGETVDDMAQNFPWWFAGAFQKWPGRWNEMPVDAHMLIALSAPRPVFLTGGTADQWADPVGEYLAAVAAGPVYRLLGAKDLFGNARLSARSGSAEPRPPLDTPLTSGDIGWHYHTGAHAATAADWNAFLVFLDSHFGRK